MYHGFFPGNITFYSNDDTDEEDEDDEVGPVPDLLVATRHRKLRRTDTSVCMVVTPDHCLTPSKKKIIEEGIYHARFGAATVPIVTHLRMTIPAVSILRITIMA